MAMNSGDLAPIDTTVGKQAYALAIEHRAQLEPRLPLSTIELLHADRDLAAAEMATHSTSRPAGATKKKKRAAAVRRLEAVARIAGAGALSFAQDAVVRAQFVALKPQKKD